MPQEVIKKNHMDVAWHEYTDEKGGNVPVVDSSIAEKAAIIGRVGIDVYKRQMYMYAIMDTINHPKERNMDKLYIVIPAYNEPVSYTHLYYWQYP